MKEVEMEQLEEQKRNEERQQLEERRRKVEEKKKEDKKRREVEKQKLEEPPNSWERDSENGDEAAGEARGQERPAQTATVEERMEAYLRVASPDIPALFPRWRGWQS